MLTRKHRLRSLLVIALALSLTFAACARSSRDPTPVPTTPETTPTVSVAGSLNVFPSVADMVEVAIPAVVSITTGSLDVSLLLDLVPQIDGAGSGVLFDPDGFIVTNDHVLANARHIQVTLTDGEVYDAEVVGRDPLTDLAVIKISGEGFPWLPFGDGKMLRVGDTVIAIGHALVIEGSPTVTSGVVSALDRTVRLSPTEPALQGLVQTDASINPGNSGGPLLNLNGEVIGINTAIDKQIPGIGFAIGTDTLLQVVDQLKNHGRIIWGYLGVQLATVTPNLAQRFSLDIEEGVLVTSVLAGTPAHDAGLQPLDVVTNFDGAPITTHEEMIQMIRDHTIGEPLEVTYFRDGEEFTTTVTLIERAR